MPSVLVARLPPSGFFSVFFSFFLFPFQPLGPRNHIVIFSFSILYTLKVNSSGFFKKIWLEKKLHNTEELQVKELSYVPTWQQFDTSSKIRYIDYLDVLFTKFKREWSLQLLTYAYVDQGQACRLKPFFPPKIEMVKLYFLSIQFCTRIF